MTYNELVTYLKKSRDMVDDNTALIGKAFYPDWRVGEEVKEGDRRNCDGVLWKCIKGHTTQEQWKPSINTASLWSAIDETHAGTKDDPIPVPEALTSFEYEWGKYYTEAGKLYLCNRQGGKVGDKYTLAYKPSQLVGQYFEAVI